MRVARLLFIAFTLCAQLARGDPFKYEFLFLPSAQVIGTFDRQAPTTQIHDEVIQADTLLTLQRGRIKLFGEYLVSDHEGDLERLQLGWQLSDDTILWIGRFHQPSSVWNHDHHHGQYLQTSPGDAGQPKAGGWSSDAIRTGDGSHDVIIDHCTLTWATNKNVAAAGSRFVTT